MAVATSSSWVALGEALRMAVDALRSHKLRSYLTLVGIVLAVATLVAVMSVVNGLNLYVADRIANLGANAFVVDRMGIITNLRAFAAAQRRPPLAADDYRALANGQLELSGNVGAVENSVADVRAGDVLSQDVNLMGATPNYGEIRKLDVAAGRFITEADELHRQSVCFLGAQLADRLFPNVNALGKSVRAGNHTGIGLHLPGQELEQGRFPAAITANQRQPLAWLDLQHNVIK